MPLGKVAVYWEIKDGIIASCSICEDSLSIKPIKELEKLLANKAYDKAALTAYLDTVDLLAYLGGISTDEFLFVLVS